MAGKSETQALIERIEASRQCLGAEVAGLRDKFDVPKQLKRQVARRPWLWFGASAAAGLGATMLLRLPRRRKKRKSRLLRIVVPALLALLKPWLKSLATRELQRRLLPGPASPDTATRFPLSKS